MGLHIWIILRFLHVFITNVHKVTELNVLFFPSAIVRPSLGTGQQFVSKKAFHYFLRDMILSTLGKS